MFLQIGNKMRHTRVDVLKVLNVLLGSSNTLTIITGGVRVTFDCRDPRVLVDLDVYGTNEQLENPES